MPISDYLKRLREKVGTELLLVPSVTAAIFDDAGRILLVKHSEDVWVAPGGSIDPGETPADAVVREVWEETGLLVEPVFLTGICSGPDFLVSYANGDQVSYVMIVFECRVIEGCLKADGVETLEAKYFSESEALQLKLPAWARVVLPGVFKGERAASFAPATWRPPCQ